MDENSKKTALRETLQSLRTPGELYVIMSGATKLPFVVCNPETFDDEILLYHREEDAKNKAKELTEAHYLAGVAKLVDDQLLAFYTSLYLMGVNGLSVNVGHGKLDTSPCRHQNNGHIGTEHLYLLQ